MQEGEKNKLLEDAYKIGEGILVNNNKDDEDEELYLGMHKFNSYEKIMDVFSGRGSVQLTRAG